MTLSDMRIRKAVPADAPRLVEIMEANRHFYHPVVDGSESLARQMGMPHNVILVAEAHGKVEGFVLGTWDGARAFLFKMSVHPDFQRQGTGTRLVKEAARQFKEMGAVTLGLSAADGTGGEPNNAVPFWEKLGFEQIPARLMIHFDMDELAEDVK
ncbi:MAG: GNAT family N-acetyltransferase [Thermoplasmata archaeon]